MIGVITKLGCLDFGGPTHRIKVGDRVYLFEFVAGGGLAILDQAENPTGEECDLPEHHPFWRAVHLWECQGKAIGNDGLCVYSPAPKQRYRRISAKVHVLMGPDEPDDEHTIYIDAY